MYVISFFVDVTDDNEQPTYVKWYPVTHNHKTTWHFKPVHTPAQATQYDSRKKAEYAIKRTPDFNGNGSLTAIVEEV